VKNPLIQKIKYFFCGMQNTSFFIIIEHNAAAGENPSGQFN